MRMAPSAADCGCHSVYFHCQIVPGFELAYSGSIFEILVEVDAESRDLNSVRRAYKKNFLI